MQHTCTCPRVPGAPGRSGHRHTPLVARWLIVECASGSKPPPPPGTPSRTRNPQKPHWEPPPPRSAGRTRRVHHSSPARLTGGARLRGWGVGRAARAVRRGAQVADGAPQALPAAGLRARFAVEHVLPGGGDVLKVGRAAAAACLHRRTPASPRHMSCRSRRPVLASPNVTQPSAGQAADSVAHSGLCAGVCRMPGGASRPASRGVLAHGLVARARVTVDSHCRDGGPVLR